MDLVKIDRILYNIKYMYPDMATEWYYTNKTNDGAIEVYITEYCDYILNYKIFVQYVLNGDEIINRCYTYDNLKKLKKDNILIDVLYEHCKDYGSKTQIKQLHDCTIQYLIEDEHFQLNNIKIKEVKQGDNTKIIDYGLKQGESLFIDEDGKILKNEISDYLVKKYHYITLQLGDDRANKIVYCYDNGVYRPYGCDAIYREVQKILGNHGSILIDNEIVNTIKYKTIMQPKNFQCNPLVLNLKNGLLDIMTMELTPHTHTHLSTVQMDFEYDPSKDCPVFDKFCNDILTPEQQTYVYEYMGYCLTGLPNVYQQFMMLVGAPGSGKGTLLKCLQNLIGMEHCCSIDLQMLEKNQFALYRLYGKSLNICADLPKSSLGETSQLKKITGNDVLLGEPKGKDSFEFKNKCKLIASMNDLPYVDEHNMAFFRRIQWIEIDKVIKGTDDEDPELDAKLSTPAEQSGILNVLLPYIQKIVKQKRFTWNKTPEDARVWYTERQNPVIYFFRKCIEEADGNVSKKDMHILYEMWCEEKGIEPMSQKDLSEKLSHSKTLSLRFERKTYNYEQTYEWLNVGIKHELQMKFTIYKAKHYPEKIIKTPNINGIKPHITAHMGIHVSTEKESLQRYDE